ncbi:unnamed protein product [Rhizoctonia solani]|uniref:F-box domain-containing protein n=1 Tax=Rhizoctonia solani TaxID=456999 RepID=A0A8H2XDM5_9AGAM|nr:unnamed protein product [Rhizoctonia solani]
MYEEHPPRKRTRTKARASKRGKKAKLGRLLDMPPEVFNEIANHLLPMDLLSLARSNKFFRKVFMSRSSQHIWIRALGNLPDLPPCPPELNVPAYVSLIFSKTCSSCGARVLRRMDPYLYVRLCNSCRDEQLFEMSLFTPLCAFLPKSDVINHPRPGFVYTLESEFQKIKAAAEKDQDEDAFTKWQEERIAEIERRQEHGDMLEEYLNLMEEEREMELDDLKQQRHNQIEARLLKEGWSLQDMASSPNNSAEWHKRTWQPKPITDRVWANLYPKLVPLLKSNRAYHDRVEKESRRRARIKKLRGLADSIRQALPPLVHLTLKPPEDNETTGSSAPPARASSVPEYPDKNVDQPFPAMTELLTWPMIKNIVDDDTSPEDAETRFGEVRAEFDQAVVEWREKIEQDLVEIWHAGRDEDREDQVESSTRKGKGKAVKQTAKTNTRGSRGRTAVASKSTAGPASHSVELVLPDFVATFTKPDGTTTTNLSDLSPNLQLLLRADTLFKSSQYSRDYAYPGIVPRAAPFCVILGGPDELMYGERWDAGLFKRDDETSAVAKELLALAGRSEASVAEMEALGGNFRCGGCNRTLTDTWYDLVRHYATEQGRWRQAQEKIKAEPKAGFVFNNTHDLRPGNPRPFAHFMTPQAASDYTIENSTHDMPMMTCMRCEKMGIQARYFHTLHPNIGSSMIEHLHDVHGVTGPRIGFDFKHWEHDVQFLDPFESDEDDFDSEELL